MADNTMELHPHNAIKYQAVPRSHMWIYARLKYVHRKMSEKIRQARQKWDWTRAKIGDAHRQTEKERERKSATKNE